MDKVEDAANTAKKDADLTPQGIDAAKDIFLKTKSSGAEVQKDLDKLITELNAVVAAVTAKKEEAKK